MHQLTTAPPTKLQDLPHYLTLHVRYISENVVIHTIILPYPLPFPPSSNKYTTYNNNPNSYKFHWINFFPIFLFTAMFL